MASRTCTFLLTLVVAAAASAAPVSGEKWTTPLPGAVAMPMAWIPAGSFTMGSPESEVGRHPDETPHQVTLTHGYWMGETEVTVAQWRAVMGTDLRGHLTKVIADDTLYEFSGKQRTIRDFMNMKADNIGQYLANEDLTLPMYFTSWNDAMAFCMKLTDVERAAGRLPAGYRYSLPTEAQWEYAARAGTTTPMFAPEVDDIAWYSANSTKDYAGKSLGRTVAGPRVAGVKKANAWELRDMTGNLWEWCFDWYGPYPTGSVTDPVGADSGTFRVNRGGSWGSGPGAARSANRATNPQAEASAWRGFRIVLSFGS